MRIDQFLICFRCKPVLFVTTMLSGRHSLNAFDAESMSSARWLKWLTTQFAVALFPATLPETLRKFEAFLHLSLCIVTLMVSQIDRARVDTCSAMTTVRPEFLFTPTLTKPFTSVSTFL